jgi:hypothetical protein
MWLSVVLHLLRAVRVLRTRRGLPWVLVLLVALVRVGLLLATNPTIRAAVGIGLPTCQAAQISTPAGREGLCVVDQGIFGGGETRNVVDADHQLNMPGYQVRLVRIEVSPTHVSNWEVHPDVYPDGRGLLVSCAIVLTNTSSSPLILDPTGQNTDLLVNDIQGGGSVSFPDLPSAQGAPGLAIGGQAIASHQTATGWLSFVAPTWIPTVLTARASDLEFYRPGDTARSYVGHIRLWKVANASDAGLLRYQLPISDAP